MNNAGTEFVFSLKYLEIVSGISFNFLPNVCAINFSSLEIGHSIYRLTIQCNVAEEVEQNWVSSSGHKNRYLEHLYLTNECMTKVSTTMH